MANKSVLVIPDLHIPYHHKEAFNFLKKVKKKYSPDRVICIGDECDAHAMSFHDSDPDLPSAGEELEIAIRYLKKLYKIFPVVDVLESNHGSMIARKAKVHGIPLRYLRSYEDFLGAPPGWEWYLNLTIKLSDGRMVYFHHGLGSKSVLKRSQAMGMSVVQGHFHSMFEILYWATSLNISWAMSVGCLVDDASLAMAYSVANLQRPLLGCAVIIKGQPKLIPMLLDNKGNWIKKIL